MRKLTNYILGIIILLLLILMFLPSNRWLTRVEQYVDMNSLEYLKQIYICNVMIKEEILENDFSKEVKRLGIAVPQERIWKPTLRTTLLFGGSGGTIYTAILTDLNGLLMIFVMDKVPDNERVEIMQEVLECLRTDSPFQDTRQQIKDIRDTVRQKYE